MIANEAARISIVIATFNRCGLLEETLLSLASALQLVTRTLQVEVLIVDNNSSDRTYQIAESFRGKIENLVYLKEEQQGLSFARNAGIAAAKGDIVVFLDDDVEVESGWIMELIEPFSNNGVGVVGGRVVAYGQRELPAWLPREYGYLVSVFDPCDEPCEVETVMGANFAIRRKCFQSSGVFDVALGRKGKKLLGGEEVELFSRIRKSGYSVRYTPRATVYHKIADKLKREYIDDYAYWLGVSEARIDRLVAGRFKWIAKLIRSAIFPIAVYPISRLVWNESIRDARYAIKKNYAKGYLMSMIEIARS